MSLIDNRRSVFKEADMALKNRWKAPLLKEGTFSRDKETGEVSYQKEEKLQGPDAGSFQSYITKKLKELEDRISENEEKINKNDHNSEGYNLLGEQEFFEDILIMLYLHGLDFVTKDKTESLLIDDSQSIMTRDLRFANLEERRFRNADLSDFWFDGCSLKGAEFEETKLDRASFIDCDLECSKFLSIEGDDIDFRHARLIEATIKDSILNGSKFINSKARGITIERCKLESAILIDVNFEKANFSMIRIDKSSIERSNFSEAVFKVGQNNLDDFYSSEDNYPLLCSFTGVEFDNAKFPKADLSGIDLRLNPDLDDYIGHQRFVESLERKTKGDSLYEILFVVWAKTTDYGRSPKRLLITAISVMFFFSLLYWGLAQYIPVDSLFKINEEVKLLPSCLYYPYFSIVTFTTLGFGDITPIHIVTIILVGLEVLLGYVTLGGLVSFLANWFGRK